MPPPDLQDRPRRFYAAAEAGPVEQGWGVLLDGRAARTPSGPRLVVPTKALAALLAEEWAAQEQTIDMAAMAATRLAFAAADRVARAREETAAEVGRYAGADLLCYFADGPDALIARQTQRWGSLLDWAREALNLEFHRTVGIIHRPQPPQTIARVEALALALDDFALAGLAFAAGLFGSAILALALQRDQLDGAAAFDLSRLDEEFQEEKWGVDAEAAARRGHLAAEVRMLDRWFQALR
ncbi:MAG: ATP12 family protein [Caulobacteraceae bacterium]|nr:ATP12 family protein [Caulobacteraceae bacterium]